MPKYIVELWLDGYKTEQDMEEACSEFIYDQLNMTASGVTITDLWIDKAVHKPNELSGRMIITYTPDSPQRFRIVRADLWHTLIDSTHWQYLTEPGEEDG